MDGYMIGLLVLANVIQALYIIMQWREIRGLRRSAPTLPHDYEPGPKVSKEEYERAMRVYRAIQNSGGLQI